VLFRSYILNISRCVFRSVPPSAMTTPRILTLKQIEELSSSCSSFGISLIDAMEQGFASFSAGAFNICPVQTMGAPPMAPMTSGTNYPREHYAAQVCVKSGYLTGDSHFVIKVASGGTPWTNSGLVQMYSQNTGQLELLLLDQGLLTELRTAAAGAVATRVLGPKVVTKIGMVGTGVQARYQLQYLRYVTNCRHVMIYGRSNENVMTLKMDLETMGWVVEVAKAPNDLMNHCNVIVTTTCARQGLLSELPTIHPTLLVCIGADAPGKQELAAELVAHADCLVCDSRIQTKERGEFQHALQSGLVSMSSSSVLELGEVVANSSLLANGRSLTIFDSSGVAFQDCIVAKIVYETLNDISIE